MNATLAAPSETEQQLIQTAQQALSSCNWTVGECAAQWTKRFAKGRTDADFGNLVGLSGDQIFQRRRVWETFADVYENYANLKWSHFYVSLTWEDSAECLAWADEQDATVAEMKAWRRMQHGEDLTVETEAELSSADSMGFGESFLQRADESFGDTAGRVSSDSMDENAAIANRVDVIKGDDGASVEPYAPFRKGAGSPGPKEQGDDFGPAKLSVEDAVKRMTGAIERCGRLLTDDFIRSFDNVPEKVRDRFLSAIEQLIDKTATLR